MFARAHAGHHQIAYVTNDLDAAVAMFAREYGVKSFFVFSNADTGVAGPGDAQLRIALAEVGGVEIELIEPIGASAPLYSEVLSGSPALELRFHHTCLRIEGGLENWHSHLASIDTGAHPIVTAGQMGDALRYVYTREPHLGHYIEHVWMSPELLAQMHATIPRYPANQTDPA